VPSGCCLPAARGIWHQG